MLSDGLTLKYLNISLQLINSAFACINLEEKSKKFCEIMDKLVIWTSNFYSDTWLDAGAFFACSQSCF